MYSGNVSDLWREFSDCVLEAVIPSDAYLSLYADGSCALAWSGLGPQRFATFGLARNWLVEQRRAAWDAVKRTSQA